MLAGHGFGARCASVCAQRRVRAVAPGVLVSDRRAHVYVCVYVCARACVYVRVCVGKRSQGVHTEQVRVLVEERTWSCANGQAVRARQSVMRTRPEPPPAAGESLNIHTLCESF
jgi:hypothetical protein